ncbi:MAG: HAD-IIB family hydrolase, partial [Acidobacteriota bacterium]
MKAISQAGKDTPRLGLFLDYDGTLVPIRKTPELAVLKPSRRRLLERLSRNIFVCIVSGRSLDDIRKLVDLRDIAYIGNHGLEMTYRNLRWTHPHAVRARPVLRETLVRIRRRTKPWTGL